MRTFIFTVFGLLLFLAAQPAEARTNTTFAAKGWSGSAETHGGSDRFLQCRIQKRFGKNQILHFLWRTPDNFAMRIVQPTWDKRPPSRFSADVSLDGRSIGKVRGDFVGPDWLNFYPGSDNSQTGGNVWPAITEAKTLSISLRGMNFSFDISDAAPALKILKQCFDRKGKQNAVAAAPDPQPATAAGTPSESRPQKTSPQPDPGPAALEPSKTAKPAEKQAANQDGNQQTVAPPTPPAPVTAAKKLKPAAPAIQESSMEVPGGKPGKQSAQPATPPGSEEKQSAGEETRVKVAKRFNADAGWRGAVVRGEERNQFASCIIQASFDKDTSLALAQTKTLDVQIISRGRSWSGVTGERVPVRVFVDNVLVGSFEGLITGTRSLKINVGKSETLLDRIARGRRLTLDSPVRALTYDVEGSQRAIAQLRRCVITQGKETAVAPA